MKFKQGFTLIELLISIVILALLLSVASFSYQFMLTRWGKELGAFESHVELQKSVDISKRVLAGTFPYVVRDSLGVPSFLFVGSSSSLISISNTGGFYTSTPEIYKFTVVPINSDKVKLLYQGSSMSNNLILSTQQEIIFTRETVLFDGADSISFRYFGWENYKSKLDDDAAEGYWSDLFSGVDRQLVPDKIELSIKFKGKNLNYLINLNSESYRELSPYFEN